MRAFSSGGGVQSTTALILSAQRKIDFPIHLFSNVGEDSEHPDTLDYVRQVLMPYAAKNGVEFQEIKRDFRNGETLYQKVLREEKRIEIPVRMKNGAPGNRGCTKNFKISVIRKWLGSGNHVIGLGISLDEFQRMRDSGSKRFVNEYPLIDLRLSRVDCLKIVRDEGLPQPPKSSCWFCPYHNKQAWQDLRRKRPDLFQKAVELEEILNKKRLAMGRDDVFLTGRGKPLSQVVSDQPLLFEVEDACESGYCMV